MKHQTKTGRMIGFLLYTLNLVVLIVANILSGIKMIRVYHVELAFYLAHLVLIIGLIYYIINAPKFIKSLFTKAKYGECNNKDHHFSW